ncbi:2-dehydro-3-deoxy-D-arabinonate dehydratase [Catalinimonas alkaloidigena]|uniref:2-dehydro-3-deoxy-D-arabinonate dehydratase n=1 Tax=Catalinimonas alkaloidigena TaxID=1075417 RepID=A0A1G9G8G2_9BACT|nr:fumarylacetoacetate hydrolase family protein [Catalinimonas alkaloidigena]SDK97018.1 2-dehydro-3-deoxy-D-arabinonate dehydratase [Catalinimonas alkaloidigena]
MRLFHTTRGAILEQNDHFWQLPDSSWDALINRDDLPDHLQQYIAEHPADAQAPSASELLPPIGQQEVWASGVTYYRSREARMEESEAVGGGSFYDRVYHADRPELFFKATAARTVGPGGTVNIRTDSTWNVPEPELTLFATSNGKIVGYTVGNDMSSRSIEGENPLYLPQAKSYEGSAALGPCLFVTSTPLPPSTDIQLVIFREQEKVIDETIKLEQMKRTPAELVDYLFHSLRFPHGCFLMTGTGIVPDNFTLQPGDEVRISIQGIGTLVNPVGVVGKPNRVV